MWWSERGAGVESLKFWRDRVESLMALIVMITLNKMGVIDLVSVISSFSEISVSVGRRLLRIF